MITVSVFVLIATFTTPCAERSASCKFLSMTCFVPNYKNLGTPCPSQRMACDGMLLSRSLMYISCKCLNIKFLHHTQVEAAAIMAKAVKKLARAIKSVVPAVQRIADVILGHQEAQCAAREARGHGALPVHASKHWEDETCTDKSAKQDVIRSDQCKSDAADASDKRKRSMRSRENSEGVIVTKKTKTAANGSHSERRVHNGVVAKETKQIELQPVASLATRQEVDRREKAIESERGTATPRKAVVARAAEETKSAGIPLPVEPSPETFGSSNWLPSTTVHPKGVVKVRCLSRRGN